MSTRDVLRLRVKLGVVGDGDTSLVVHGQLGWEGVGVAELLLIAPVVNGLLGRLGACHERGLAGRERDRVLLLAAPEDGGLVEHENEARSRVLDRPVGVGHAVQREVVALVGQAEVLGALEIVEHAKGVSEEVVGRLGHRAAEVNNGEGDVGASVYCTCDAQQRYRALTANSQDYQPDHYQCLRGGVPQGQLLFSRNSSSELLGTRHPDVTDRARTRTANSRLRNISCLRSWTSDTFLSFGSLRPACLPSFS